MAQAQCRVHHQFLSAVQAAAAAGSITERECGCPVHHQLQQGELSLHVPACVPSPDTFCPSCLRRFYFENACGQSADASAQALVCLHSTQNLCRGPSTAVHLGCLRALLQATAGLIDVVAWQQQDRQTQTSNQSNSLAHARRPRKAASHARQRPLLQANQQGLTCLLQAHQQGLACLAAMMRDPSSNVLGICVALCLLNFQHLAALCPSEEGLDVESRVLVRKHMGALLEKWPLLSGVSADIDAPQEDSASQGSPAVDEDLPAAELGYLVGVLTEVGVAAAQQPLPPSVDACEEAIMGPCLPLPSSAVGIITAVCIQAAICLCSTVLKHKPYSQAGHSAMQISLLGVARLWPYLDADEQYLLRTHDWPETGFASTVNHLIHVYQNVIVTARDEVPYQHPLHVLGLNEYVSIALAAVLLSGAPEHLRVMHSGALNLWLRAVTTVYTGMSGLWRDWHVRHAQVQELIHQRVRKAGAPRSAIDPGEVERYTVRLVALKAGTGGSVDIDPALKQCTRLSQPLVDLRLLRSAARMLLIGGRVDDMADQETARLISALTLIGKLALLGWGIPQEYRANRARTAMFLATNDAEDAPVMRACASLNAATARALLSGILGVCAMSAAEDVGQLPPEVLQLEGVGGRVRATDLLEPDEIWDTASLRMVPLMAVKCLDWIEAVSVSLVNYEIACMGDTPGLTDIEIMVDAVQGLTALTSCGARLFDDEDDERAALMGYETESEDGDEEGGAAGGSSAGSQGSREGSDEGKEQDEGSKGDDSSSSSSSSIDGGPAWPAPHCWDWQRVCSGAIAQHLLLDKVVRVTIRGLRALADPDVMGGALRPSTHMDPAPAIIDGVLRGWARIGFDVCEMISWGENELCEHAGHLMAEAATHTIQLGAELVAAASSAIAACVRRGHVKAQAPGGSTSSTGAGSSSGAADAAEAGTGNGPGPPSLQQLQASLETARAWLQVVLPFVSTLALLPLGSSTLPTWTSAVSRKLLGAAAGSSPLTLHYIIHHGGDDAERTYLDAIHYCCPGGEEIAAALVESCPLTVPPSDDEAPASEQSDDGGEDASSQPSPGCKVAAVADDKEGSGPEEPRRQQRQQQQAVRPPRWAQVAAEPLPRLLASLPPKPLSPWLEETVQSKSEALMERMALRAFKALWPHASRTAIEEALPLFRLPKSKLRELGIMPPAIEI